MPTYDYLCDLCGHAFEYFQSMQEARLKDCPGCGKPGLRRLIGAGAGVVFKGSGFYETDYKRKSGAGADKGRGAAGESGKPPASERKAGDAPAGDTGSGDDKSGDAKSAGTRPAGAGSREKRGQHRDAGGDRPDGGSAAGSSDRTSDRAERPSAPESGPRPANEAGRPPPAKPGTARQDGARDGGSGRKT